MTATPTTPPATPTAATAPTTRAITQGAYGSTDTLALAEVARPTPGPGEVLVRVRAAGVDRGVLHLMTGTPYLIRLMGFGLTAPKQPVLGMDLAGTVAAVGSGVTRFAVGDEVLGIGTGAFAEYALAPQDKLAHKPAGLDWAQAAVVSVSGITAQQAIHDIAGVSAGQQVLVLGASGGVGSYAVQLAHAAGAHVTGVASAEKADHVRDLGAERVLDYRTTDPTADGIRYDVIIDIGGRTPLRRLRRALTPTGTLVIVGGEGGNRLTGGIGRQLRAMALSPFVRQRLTFFVATESHEAIERLCARIESGAVRPAVEATYALAEAPAALADLESGRLRGKAALVIGSDS